MQSVLEQVNALKAATHGEVEAVVENALKRIYPDEKISFYDLRKQKLENGDVTYVHSETGAVIGKISVRPEYVETLQEETSWGHAFFYNKKVPFRENIILYSPQGNVDTRITTEYAELPEGFEDKFKVVTGIKEYYPPAKKRKAKTAKHKQVLVDEKQAAKNLRAARAFKAENGSAAPVNGAKTKLSTTKRQFNQQAPDPTAAQSFSENGAASGPIRRERKYVVKRINRYSSAIMTESSFSLGNRISKDRMNHRDGDYTVIRHADNMLMTTHYNKTGRRIEQHTYNSEGELIKALGESIVSGENMKRRCILPSDKESLARAKERSAFRELEEYGL